MISNPDDDFDLAARIEYCVKMGAISALLEHKRNGVSIVVLENGKVVEITPEKIEIPEYPQVPSYLVREREARKN